MPNHGMESTRRNAQLMPGAHPHDWIVFSYDLILQDATVAPYSSILRTLRWSGQNKPPIVRR
jgi:hypothetical protein